eukprot:TRINITY_DN10175_c0_g3_i1.p1 TRINITY_DN10175_c0_g3~~TRINITY_DN10175_c0_g3_i1.p1  ORF type:complete len:343 (+),score=43.12 TRINITY_DN10175_c0_g3_i1:75-1031(+)
MSWKSYLGTVVGTSIAVFAGNKAGDMVFGDEGTKQRYNRPLEGRADRFERDHPIYDFHWEKPRQEVALSKDEWRGFPLQTRLTIGPDAQVLRFQLPNSHMRMGMRTCGFVLLRYKDSDGKFVVRPYTPVSMDWETGKIDIMVKKYPGSKMGTHCHDLKIGQHIEIKGPFDKYILHPDMHATIGCIAGGSGVTPMYQAMMYCAKWPTCKTNTSLILANNSSDNIVMGDHVNFLATTSARANVYHTVLEADEKWTGGVGYVNKSMIKAKMPPPGEGKVFVCGPPAMMEAVCGPKGEKGAQGPLGGLLKDMGYSEEDVYKF